MKKVFLFLTTLIKEIIDDDVYSLSAALTYKLLFAFFPLVIFLITLLAFLPIDSTDLLNSSVGVLPAPVYDIINSFITEVVSVKRPDLLSISLLIAIFSSTSGIVGLMLGLNKAFNIKKRRGFVAERLTSLFLLFILVVALLGSFLIIVFSEDIRVFLLNHNIFPNVTKFFFSFSQFFVIMIVLMIVILIVFKVSVQNGSTYKSLLPGALFSSIGFVVISLLFNYYTSNLYDYSNVYGSVAGIFMLIIWLNITSYLLLIGGEINAVLFTRKNEKRV